MAQPSYSFVDLREAITEIGKLKTEISEFESTTAALVGRLRADVSALTAKNDSGQASNASPVVGALVDGAMSLVNQRLSQYEAKLAKHEQYMTNLELKLRAAVPQMPDMEPLVKGLHELVKTLGQQAVNAKAPAELPGIAALTQTVTKLTQAQHELCARMDKPVVREGVADLPSGQVKMRITETRGK